MPYDSTKIKRAVPDKLNAAKNIQERNNAKLSHQRTVSLHYECLIDGPFAEGLKVFVKQRKFTIATCHAESSLNNIL